MASIERSKMNNHGGYTAAEHELTQILVTELLAHQFCFPVQWIDTQDVILGEFATERLVEIGPAETLTNMASRTLAAGYKSHDVALGLRRELLSYKKDAEAIYYDAPEQEPAAAAPAAPAAASTIPSAAPTPEPAPVAAPAAAAPSVAVPDTAVSPHDVITTLVSVGLNKKPSDIAQDQTLKALCGGRSTVQNEIIGNLTKELGSLPDQPEDIALGDLASAMAESGLGTKLGAFSNGLVNKLVTGKMPASSSASALRQYLERRWGFKQGLQDRALLAAIPSQPAGRLGSEKEMHAFLDGVAMEVLRGVGIDPASLSAPGGGGQQAGSGAAVAVSSEAMKAFESQQRKQAEALMGVYAKQLGHDLNGAKTESRTAKATINQLQAKVDAWSAEHGEAYERGIAPSFDAKKVRKYDSYWNWAVHQVVALFSAALVGEPAKFAAEAQQSIDLISTRASPRLLQVIGFLLKAVKDVPESESRRKQIARDWLLELDATCRASVASSQPSYKVSVVSKVPVLKVDDRGRISVTETPRMVPSFEVLVDSPPDSFDDEDNDNETLSLVEAQSYYSGFSPRQPSIFENGLAPPATTGSPFSSAIDDTGLPPAPGPQAAQSAHAQCPNNCMESNMWTPRIKTKGRSGWRTNHDITNGYLGWFQRCSAEGVSFGDKTVLVTGAGKTSIGSEIVSMLLAAGAQVVVTTSSYSPETCAYYRDLYHSHGARNSRLVLVPFNGGSNQDVHNLVQYIYDDESKGGLGWDLDHIVPFAAMGEAGRAIDGIDDRSELAHRVMLTNVVRLLGSIKAVKASRRITTHPTHVLLPLSPNHGVFGQDGLYAESKMALEALMMKWWSEDWNEYLTLCGTVIGWTRGTGLMNNNDVLATGIEADLGIRTFSASEMAWHIVGLMDASTASFCDLEPLMADLSGGLSSLTNLKPVLRQIQDKIDSESDMNKSLYKERLRETDVAAAGSKPPARRSRAKKAMLQVERASLPDYQEFEPLAAKLQDMVDLERVVVVVGFGEVGPYGSSRTRWEAECSGTFSISGCLELAWVMGLVQYHSGRLNGKDYCGWIDTKTKAPIADAEVKARYEEHILQHTGIRIVEQQIHDITSPDREQKLHEVVIVEDMGPFEVPLETADELKREHGDNVVVTEDETEGGQCSIILKAGTTLWVPKAAKSRSTVGAQMPAGWDPKTYGIPDDIIGQVDPVTLYALVATVEAFLSAGLTDPYELYNHMHVSELGNTLGTSMGGQRSLDRMFKRRFLDRQVQNDILAETFVNTTAAWVNMLLAGSSGPIRTAVGACATALESMDAGYDMIVNGRVKAVLVGGTDALERDIAREFANMQATINAGEDAARGRTPKEASRPATSTRAGFVEGEGCGVQLLTTARMALDKGLPIRGVIALTHMASDGIGRSVPSPGKGMLTIATEKRSSGNKHFASPLLDIDYRRRQLSLRLRQIKEKRDMELAWLEQQQKQEGGSSPTDEYVEPYRNEIHADAQRACQEAKNMYGNQFWKHDKTISPLRGALAVWGLTIDDLSVASLHGTSTKQNDINETAVMQAQLAFLGRTEGNVLPCCLQKGLLGHGKGAAGAFAVNSGLQMLASGLIPGNPNADNIDAALQDRSLLYFPSQTYKNPAGVKAFSVTSFGFGQKGAQVIGINAKYLFATLSRDEYEIYKRKVAKREAAADRALQEGVYGGQLVKLKEKNLYDKAELEKALLYREI